MTVRILVGDARDMLATMPAASVQCAVTSPPYLNLRSYLPDNHAGKAFEIGAEATAGEYISNLVAVFREVRRVLADDGTCWIVLGDCFKDKQLQLMPYRVAMALQADGWILRSNIVWAKSNPMPESVKGSHFSRHRVTIADYERLSGLPYIDERAGDDWAGDVPDMSGSKAPRSKAPLRAEREGQGNRSGARGARGRQGEETAGVGVRCSESTAGEILEDRKSEGEGEKACRCVCREREGQAQGSRTLSAHKGFAEQDCDEEARQRCVCQDREDGCEEAQGLRQTERGSRPRETVHCRDVARSGVPLQGSVPLLQAGAGSNPGSRDPYQQRRDACSGEHRSRLPELQREEGRQDRSSLLVGCPGCDKCVEHHGYIFHLSAGRPTSAHESVFLLTKRAKYYYNADAVREPGSPNSHARRKDGGNNPKAIANADRREGNKPGLSNYVIGSPRNLRNVWNITPTNFRGAHFATFPVELARRCILAGSRQGDTILDPFFGAGTTALACPDRHTIGIDISADYAELARARLAAAGLTVAVDLPAMLEAAD